MELTVLFNKWKLNHNHFADLLSMPKGTFNNKLNLSHKSYFKNEELLILKKHIKDMAEDLKVYANAYLEGEEDFQGIIDEKITYNNKEI